MSRDETICLVKGGKFLGHEVLNTGEKKIIYKKWALFFLEFS
jgi:hypothetical protein